MVRAPRSRGCRACVERRIKCDQARPYCNRCQQMRRECPGYGIRIVDETQAVQSLYHVGGRSALATLPSSSSESPNGIAAADGTRHQTKVSPRDVLSSNLPAFDGHRANPDRMLLYSFMAPQAYQSQLLSAFLESTVTPQHTRLPDFPHHSIWLAKLAEKESTSNLLTSAIRAVSVSHLARSLDDGFVLEAARRHYSKALLTLNATLQDPEESLSSDTLSAVALLTLFEVFNCTENQSWVLHAGGVSRLIFLRGPDRHRSGFDREVFLGCRTQILMEAFQKRRGPCYLESPPWRKLIKDIHADKNSSNPFLFCSETFLERAEQLPGYNFAVVSELKVAGCDHARLQDLINKGLDHRSKLQQIQALIKDILAQSGREIVQCKSSWKDTQFPLIYQYPNSHVGTLYCLLWTVTSLVNVSIVAMEAKISRPYDSQSRTSRGSMASVVFEENGAYTLRPNFEQKPFWDAIQSLDGKHVYMAECAENAREICRSAEYMSQTHFLGLLSLTFALKAALRMFLTFTEKQWIAGVLYKIGQKMGLARVNVETSLNS